MLLLFVIRRKSTKNYLEKNFVNIFWFFEENVFGYVWDWNFNGKEEN